MATDTTGAETTSPRLAQNWRDMVISLGVVLALILVVYFLTYRPAPDNAVRAVDYIPTVNAARATGPFPVAVPAHSDGWTANSVRYRPDAADPKVAAWHLGFVTATDQYVAVEQTNGADPDFIKTATADGKNDGPLDLAGMSFTRYDSASTGHKSLLYKNGGVTTIVTGTLSYDDLAAFAADLRTS